MSDEHQRLAIHCRFLRRTIEVGAADSLLTLCQHPVREGRPCVGPFLEDLGTACGLWERDPQAGQIALPEPERWQRRRRREGYDLTRSYQGDW